jgi:hypothetical protein
MKANVYDASSFVQGKTQLLERAAEAFGGDLPKTIRGLA